MVIFTSGSLDDFTLHSANPVASTQQRHARANAPAAQYWLHTGAKDEASPLCKGCQVLAWAAPPPLELGTLSINIYSTHNRLIEL